MGGSSEKIAGPRKRPRRCVGCGSTESKGQLLRIARSPEGEVVLDAAKMPGRGAYICKNIECVRLAKKKNAFSRALKTPVTPAIYEHLESLCQENRETEEKND